MNAHSQHADQVKIEISRDVDANPPTLFVRSVKAAFFIAAARFRKPSSTTRRQIFAIALASDEPAK